MAGDQMFRGVLILHAHNQDALDRVWRRIMVDIREEPGRGISWDAFGVQTMEERAFLEREKKRFDQAGAGHDVKNDWDTNGISDQVIHRNGGVSQ